MVQLLKRILGRKGKKVSQSQSKGEDDADLPSGSPPPVVDNGPSKAKDNISAVIDDAPSKAKADSIAPVMADDDKKNEAARGGLCLLDRQASVKFVATAAKVDFEWDADVGTKPGVEVWRVENTRTKNGNPNFGIAPWPRDQYGQFHRGDSYIVLLTVTGSSKDNLRHDIYFWIGSESTQDEYGVAAYKAVELDDLLGREPVQHREVEGRESKGFAKCFPKGIMYLEGGVDSGFRHVSGIRTKSRRDIIKLPDVHRLYRVYKKAGEPTTRCFEVPLSCSSLNDGDAFILDAGTHVYTWFGRSVSAFEKSKSAAVVGKIKENRLCHCQCITLDPGADNNEHFWSLLGGRGTIKRASVAEREEEAPVPKKMYVVSDASGITRTKEVPFAKSSLVSDDVCIVDAGGDVYVWIGKGSTKAEKQQSMMISYRYLKEMERHETTRVTRVMEGQEARCPSFLTVF